MRPALLAALAGCGGIPVVDVYPAEHNHLAVVIGVTEDEPVHAEGRCTSDDGEVRVLPRQGPSELIDLPLAGMTAGSRWTCTVDVDHGDRVRTWEVEATPGELPVGVGGWEVQGSQDPRAATLLTEWDHDRGHPNMRTVILDAEGRPRWYRFTDHEVIAGFDGTVTPSGLVLTGGGPDQPPTWYDSLGEQVVALGEPPIPGAYHHHVEPFEGGVVTLITAQNTTGDRDFTGFAVVWFGPTGAPEWTWDSQRAVDDGTLVPGPGDDPFHANAVTLLDDPLGPAAWVSLYNARSIVRIDRDTGALTHTLGPGGDFALVDPSGAPLPDEAWFSGTHDPEFDWPRVLIYDNGLDAGRSRAVELELDLAAATATLTWEWTEPGWFEPIFGDADRVSGGILLARGRCWTTCGPYDLDPDRRTTVVEVGDDGDIRWRLDAPDADRGVYRAERVDPCLLWDDPAICDGPASAGRRLPGALAPRR